MAFFYIHQNINQKFSQTSKFCFRTVLTVNLPQSTNGDLFTARGDVSIQGKLTRACRAMDPTGIYF